MVKSADGRFEYRGQDDTPLPRGAIIADAHRFGFICRSEKRWCSVNLRGRGHDVPEKSWILTGSIDVPTLAPSINCSDCWHGYIEGGVYVDCDHKREEKQ